MNVIPETGELILPSGINGRVASDALIPLSRS